ncbi:unnamed protein product [Leptidea sinapis]|uniref:Transmembrane protein 179 n=1 Tax=Leptidea sinapis TaxID=189913 RepID=A0A5E4PR66_9NEOP|nr:unnamed protein product [Leptidea sinapis]
MALTNVLLLSQIAGYVIGLILSLCIMVPLSMHQNEFSGHCLLFSRGTWQEEDGQLLVMWASRAYCNYVIVVGVLMFIVCCIQIYSCEDATGQDIDKKDKISTHGFYIELGTAQFGAWGAFATWVGLAVFSTLKVCRYHQLENIQVSMFRERQRLVNDTPPGDALQG